MKRQYLMTYLPSEIMTEILSRLPAEAILRCKCVCKSWCDLLGTREFAKFHLSKSVPGLALMVEPFAIDKNTEPTNVLDIRHNLDFSTITKLHFSNYYTLIQGSVDGLLLLRMINCTDKGFEIRVCNPITRDYIDLRYVQHLEFGVHIFGFGVSKITREYKAVDIFQDKTSKTPKGLPESESECKVYNLGTGSWRSVAPHALLRYSLCYPGAFVNGNLHWMAHDLNSALWISCLDLETELFTTFSPPPPLCNGSTIFYVYVVVVEGSLCLCDYTSDSNMVIIWLMKEYGNEKSWTKEFVFENLRDLKSPRIYPIKISEDGAILMVLYCNSFFYYSRKNKTVQRICSSRGCVYINSHSNTPSLLSLKYFRMENSISY